MSSPINVLLFAFVDICRLRLAPQGLPASSFLLGAILTAFTLLNFIIGAVDVTPRPAVAAALLNTGLLVLFTTIALRLRNHSARLPQTLTALAGSGALLGLLFLPIALLGSALESAAAKNIVAVSWLLLLAWNVLIIAHILRHALSVPLSFGFTAALLYLWITFSSMYAFIYPLVQH